MKVIPVASKSSVDCPDLLVWNVWQVKSVDFDHADIGPSIL